MARKSSGLGGVIKVVKAIDRASKRADRERQKQIKAWEREEKRQQAQYLREQQQQEREARAAEARWQKEQAAQETAARKRVEKQAQMKAKARIEKIKKEHLDAKKLMERRQAARTKLKLEFIENYMR